MGRYENWLHRGSIRRSRLGQSKAFSITSQLKVSDFSSTSRAVNALKAKRNCFGDRLKSSSEQPLFLFAFFKEKFQIWSKKSKWVWVFLVLFTLSGRVFRGKSWGCLVGLKWCANDFLTGGFLCIPCHITQLSA